jgi:hypothetical protein
MHHDLMGARLAFSFVALLWLAPACGGKVEEGEPASQGGSGGQVNGVPTCASFCPEAVSCGSVDDLRQCEADCGQAESSAGDSGCAAAFQALLACQDPCDLEGTIEACAVQIDAYSRCAFPGE